MDVTLSRILLCRSPFGATRGGLAATVLDRYACLATVPAADGPRTVFGPAAAGLFAALEWAGTLGGTVRLDDPDLGRSAVLPWTALRPRRWSAQMRISLGTADFEDAVTAVAAGAPDALLHVEDLHLDWMACRLTLRGVVAAPTLDLAQELGAHAALAWFTSAGGLRDQLGDGLAVRFTRLQSLDGRIKA